MNILFKVLRKMLTFTGMPFLPYTNLSFSQDGEDVVLKSFYESLPYDYKGFYVDVGAHHPFRFSNTYLFYRKGWRGINVDAMPGSMRLFKKYRSRDINIEAGVGSSEEKLTFYCFNEPALNTFSKSQAKTVEENNKNVYKIVKEVPVTVLPLKDILDKHLELGVSLDFLSIDVEGFDLNVLKSNDWEKYKPKFILIESYNKNNNLITDFLVEKGYKHIAQLPRTSFFSV